MNFTSSRFLLWQKRTGYAYLLRQSLTWKSRTGSPKYFQLWGIVSYKTGLGVDSSAICSRDLFAAIPICLQTQRARDNHELAFQNKIPKRLWATVDQVLYMATLDRAEALHLDLEIMSIELGKWADNCCYKSWLAFHSCYKWSYSIRRRKKRPNFGT
jgi:hypothetical protein